MSTFFSLSTICFILLTWNKMTNGLACYTCVDCNDPFNQRYIEVLYRNDSLGFSCSKTMAAYATSRSIMQACVPSGIGGNGQWCCQTNLCNEAKRNRLTNTFSLGIIIWMFTIFF